MSRSYTSLFVVIAILFVALNSPQVDAFGYVPRILIAQIAQYHNQTLAQNLTPLLTNAFDGYYKPTDYQFPYIGGLSAKFEQDYAIFEQLSFNPSPFNVGPKNDKNIKPRAVSQTNAPWLAAQAIMASSNVNSTVWSRAQNVASMMGLVSGFHNPLHNINLFSSEFPHGDESGSLFPIEYTSPATKYTYHTLLSAFDDVFGYKSPTSGLVYSDKEQSEAKLPNDKPFLSKIQSEAHILMEMFPASSFRPEEINIPETYTRSSINTVFKGWCGESFLLAMNAYNSFFNYPKKQSVGELLSDDQNNLLFAQFPTHFSDFDQNDITNDELTKIIEQLEQFEQFEHSSSSLNPHRIGVLNPADGAKYQVSAEQIYYFRYMSLKQIAKAGYRLSSVLAQFSNVLKEGVADHVHPGWVHAGWRAVTIIVSIFGAVFIYFLLTQMCFFVKAKNAVDQIQHDDKDSVLLS
jgi:hypothetical protein